jgi:hypothetical protein
MIDRTCTDLEGTFTYMDDTRVGSLDFELSRGKTLVFPRLNLFWSSNCLGK